MTGEHVAPGRRGAGRGLPVRGEGRLRVLYWLWTYAVLWRELKADDDASTSSSLMSRALG